MLDMSLRKRTTGVNILAVILVVFIILNMAFIWINSAKVSSESDKSSTKIAKTIAEKTVKDFNKLSKNKQQAKIKETNGKIRSTAHFAEFVPLGFLVLLLMINILFCKKKIKLVVFCSVLALLICALCALSDEIHQIFVKGRSFEVKDILTDTLGSLVGIVCGLIVIVSYKSKKHCFAD